VARNEWQETGADTAGITRPAPDHPVSLGARHRLAGRLLLSEGLKKARADLVYFLRLVVLAKMQRIGRIQGEKRVTDALGWPRIDV
jgi:hypothetical protein